MADDIVEELLKFAGNDPDAWLVRYAADEIKRLRADLDEDEALRERMSSILRSVADALHGGPLPNGLHSWHDLPEIAQDIYSQWMTLRQNHWRLIWGLCPNCGEKVSHDR